MNDVIHAEWRNNNQRTKYPFADSATLVNDNGVSIDRDLFDDARIYPIGGGAGLYLGQIRSADAKITFAIFDPVEGELAAGVLDVEDIGDDIPIFDSLGRPAGLLVSSASRLSSLFSLYGTGVFDFEPDETEFAASVAIPMPQVGVRGLLLDDGSFVAGDVYLVGTDGVVLSMDAGAIRVDIIGDPYALIKACIEEGFPVPAFCGLRTINLIPPDDNGDFKLTIGGNVAADTILRVEQAEPGVLLLKAVGRVGGNG
jgi:hypothetical protein